MNLNIYLNNKDSEVLSPNPATTDTNRQSGDPLPTIVPQFISSGLGPSSTTNTMTYDIDLGLRTTQTVPLHRFIVNYSGIEDISSSHDFLPLLLQHHPQHQLKP